MSWVFEQLFGPNVPQNPDYKFIQDISIKITICITLIVGMFYIGYVAHEYRVFPIKSFAKRSLHEHGLLLNQLTSCFSSSRMARLTKTRAI